MRHLGNTDNELKERFSTMQPVLIEQYDYPLPDDRIAKYPLSERAHSIPPASQAGR